MAVTVTGPLATPVNVVPVVNPGGDLDPNTTYYIRVVALSSTNVANWGRYSEGSRESEPSIEVFATTTAVNKTIDLTWNAVAGAACYDVYISKTSGVYLASNWPRCLRDYVSDKYSSYTTINNAFSITREPGTSGSERGSARHTFCSEEDVILAAQLGSITVSFDGATTLQDIKDAIDLAGLNNYCTYDGVNFVLKGSIHITGVNAGSMTCYQKNIIFIHGSFRNENPNVTVQFGRITGARLDDGCNFNMCGRCYIYFENNDKAYDCTFQWPACDDGPSFVYGQPEEFIWGPYAGSLYIYNSTVLGFSSALSTAFFADVSDFVAKKKDDHTIQVNDTITLTDFKALNGYITVLGGYTSVLRDFERKQNTARDFSMNQAGAGTWEIYNADLYAADNKPSVWWRYSQTVVIHSYYTLQLTVVDKNGIPILGAYISLRDRTGAEIWAGGVTDPAGQASDDILSIISSNDPGGGLFDSLYDERYPFTLTISSAGYETYKERIAELYTPQAFNFSLKRSPYIGKDGMGDLFI